MAEIDVARGSITAVIRQRRRQIVLFGVTTGFERPERGRVPSMAARSTACRHTSSRVRSCEFQLTKTLSV
jgi:hypothetical protein